jgi:hypothetical protein
MKKQVIKLVSGWSKPGGSTVHHIALTNLLNRAGYDCTFYGPHEWHLGQCQSARISDLRISSTDVVISHFVRPARIPCRRHILTCHETSLVPLRSMPLDCYDLIHFVSASQRSWHAVHHPSVVIPPVVDRVPWRNPRNRVAGVVGSIDRNKQTHEAIRLAREQGFAQVKLFGNISDRAYYTEAVEADVHHGFALLMGHEDNRERMYGQIEAVYHSSLSETYGLVEAECGKSGIPFHGRPRHPEILNAEEILSRWERVLS